MSNYHQHASPHFRNPRQQHPNHTPYRADRRASHPPFPSADHDLPYDIPQYHRRRHDPRRTRDSSGYGGAPSSDSPERGTPVICQDLSPYSWRNRNIPPPHPPFSSDNYDNEPRDFDPSLSKPSHSSNIYRGGTCPYTYAPSRTAERNRTNRNARSRPQRPLPDHEEAREASSLRDKRIAPTTGPVKSAYSSRSPVKPINSRSTPSSSPNLRSIPRNPTPTHSKPNNLYNGVINSFQIENNPTLPERRHGRSLTCEKIARQQDELSLHSSGLRHASAPLGCSAIARPTRIPPADVQPSTQNRTEKQNGSYSQTNEESVEVPENTEQKSTQDPESTNYHQNQKRDSVEQIFQRNSRRLPKYPEDNTSASSAPVRYPNSVQSKQEVKDMTTSSDAGKSHVKLPSLRSVPAPVRSFTADDTPQKRAAAAALLRAGQADCEEVKLVKDCQPGRSKSSQKDAARSDSEPQKAADDAEKEGTAARHILATSVSEPGLIDQHRQRKLEVGNLENQRMDHLNQSTEISVAEEEKQDIKSTKRRGTDLEESNRIVAKRPRPTESTETLNLEDHVGLRRSQRFQQQKTNKTWESTKFEPDRVQNLFQAQLRAQPMLLRISFLGISDGDLRSTLDTCKSEMNLPEPDYRSLEVNNNRIRCITNEICTSISGLRVSSLNLSCNMLTTIGDKLGLCSKLKFLNLSRNRLSCLPQELCDLTNLEVLNLSGNNIARLPSGLCRLKKLEILSLARNKLEVLPEDVAGQGAALTGLDISHNHRFHFFPRCAEHWTEILVLHMADTEMYRSLSRREHRLRPSALLKELAGRNQDMRAARRGALRSQSGLIRR